MSRSLVLFAAILLILAFATQAADNRHARSVRPTVSQPPATRLPWYTRSEAPQGWTMLDAARPEEQLTFSLIVKGSNADELERRFWSRSDPDSEEFSDWMTNSEIEALVAPPAAQLQQIYDTLAQYGIKAEQVTSHGDSFDVSASVRQASAFFATRFFHYQHTTTGIDTVRQWGYYSLPSGLSEQVEMVLGVHTFPTVEQRMQMRARRAAARARAATKAAESAAPSAVWVPQAMAALYGVPYPIAPLAYKEVGAGVIEWEEETFSPADLANFSTNTNNAARLRRSAPDLRQQHRQRTGCGGKSRHTVDRRAERGFDAVVLDSRRSGCVDLHLYGSVPQRHHLPLCNFDVVRSS